MEQKEHIWRQELMQAITVNDLTKLQVILNTSQEPNCDRFSLDFKLTMECDGYYLVRLYSPVTLAIQHDHAEALELLLEAGAAQSMNHCLLYQLMRQYLSNVPKC